MVLSRSYGNAATAALQVHATGNKGFVSLAYATLHQRWIRHIKKVPRRLTANLPLWVLVGPLPQWPLACVGCVTSPLLAVRHLRRVPCCWNRHGGEAADVAAAALSVAADVMTLTLNWFR